MQKSIINSLEWRYATKKFNPERKLDQQQLQMLRKAFNLTATSYGLQTIYMGILDDATVREELVQYAFGQRQVADASHLLVIAYQNNISTEDVDALFNNIKAIRNTPEKILAPYRKDLKQVITSKSKSEQHEWSIRQAYIALGNLMTVCAAEKIDACPMEGFLMEKFDEILGLEERGLKSILLLPVGYRAEDDMFSDFKKVRKSIDQSTFNIKLPADKSSD